MGALPPTQTCDTLEGMNVFPRLLSSLAAALLCGIALPNAAADEVELQQKFETANRSAGMWRERAQILEKENKALRAQIDRLLANPLAPNTPAAAAATSAPVAPSRIETTIPIGTTVSLDQFGGPKRRIQVFAVDAVKVTIQVDNTGVRSVPLGTGQPELLVDPETGDRVLLASPIKREEGFGSGSVSILIIKGK